MYCSHCNTLQIIDAYTSKETLWSFQLVSQNDKNIHIFSLAAVYQLLESCEHWKLLHALKIFKELPIKIDFKFFGFKLQKGFSGTISHILSTHIDHALMRKCHMWDASHIAHLQFRGKLDVMSIMTCAIIKCGVDCYYHWFTCHGALFFLAIAMRCTVNYCYYIC